MKKALLSLLVLTLLAAYSCKKDNSTSTSGGTSGYTGLVKSITMRSINIGGPGNTDTATTSYLSYDSKNRPTKLITVDSANGTSTSEWIYSTDLITVYVQTPIVTDTGVYYLNSDGYATSDNAGDTWTYNSNGYVTSWVATVAEGGTTTYSYNAQNELTSLNFSSVGLHTFATYSYSGNTIQVPGYSFKGQNPVLAGNITCLSNSTSTVGGLTVTNSDTAIQICTTDAQNRLNTITKKSFGYSSATGLSDTTITIQYYHYY